MKYNVWLAKELMAWFLNVKIKNQERQVGFSYFSSIVSGNQEI